MTSNYHLCDSCDTAAQPPTSPLGGDLTWPGKIRHSLHVHTSPTSGGLPLPTNRTTHSRGTEPTGNLRLISRKIPTAEISRLIVDELPTAEFCDGEIGTHETDSRPSSTEPLPRGEDVTVHHRPTPHPTACTPSPTATTYSPTHSHHPAHSPHTDNASLHSDSTRPVSPPSAHNSKRQRLDRSTTPAPLLLLTSNAFQPLDGGPPSLYQLAGLPHGAHAAPHRSPHALPTSASGPSSAPTSSLGPDTGPDLGGPLGAPAGARVRGRPNSPAAPLTVFCHNCNGLHGGTADVLAHQLRTTDPAVPGTPLVYALVEAGAAKNTRIPTDWDYKHVEGRQMGGNSSGGISIIAHSTCPVESFWQLRIDGPSSDVLQATAVAAAVLAPHGRERFLLVAAYVHPHAARRRDCMEAVCTSIDAVLTAHAHLPALVVGDFNARHEAWHDDRGGGSGNAGDTALAEAIDNMGLHIHNQPGVYTRICHTTNGTSQSIIDLVLSRPSELIADGHLTQQHAEAYHQQDHVPFTIGLTLRSRTAPATPPPSRPRTKWDVHREPLVWQRALPASISDFLAPLQPLLDSLRPADDRATDEPQSKLEAVYQRLEAAVHAACTATVSIQQVDSRGTPDVPWWTHAVAKAHKQLCNASRARVRARGNPVRLAQADALFRSTRRQWRAEVQQAKQHSREALATLVMDPDSRMRYTTLRRYQRSAFTPLTGIKDAAGNMPASHTQSLDNLCHAFISSSEPPPLTVPCQHGPGTGFRPDAGQRSGQESGRGSGPSSVPSSGPDLPISSSNLSGPHQAAADSSDDSDDWTFTAEQVAEQTRRRTSKTSAGPDAILPLFLRYGGTALWTALAVVFNYSWRHSVTPQAWREANVTALYKGKGERSEPTSYRPISVTSGIARTFEHLIHGRLAARLGPGLAKAQFGFRTRRSTTDAILQLLSPVQYLCGQHNSGAGKRLEGAATVKRYRKLRCAALFLDIQKAFDRVDHAILLDRLQAKGVKGAAWRWIRSFLTDRRMRCVDNRYESHWQPVRYGVPQGCVLSPLLFLVFIDGLITTVRQDKDCSMISPIFYADDGVLGPSLGPCRQWFISSGKNVRRFELQYSAQLKTAAAHLDRWCKASRMHFGEGKTKVVVFNRGTQRDDTLFDDVRLCGYTVGVADSYDYLGLTLANDLKWSAHVQRKLDKARDVAARLTTVALNARPVQPAVIRELVCSCLVPSFDYGIELWGIGLPDNVARSLQAAMAKPLRAASGLPYTTHQLSVLRGAGVSPVATHTQHKQLMHLQRVAQLLDEDGDHPTAQLYTQLNDTVIFRDEHRQLLDTTIGAPTPIYLVHAVLPFAVGDGERRLTLPPTRQAERRLEARGRTPGGAGRGAARVGPLRQQGDGWTALKDLHRPPSQSQPPQPLLPAPPAGAARSAAEGARTRLRAIRDLAAHLEWTESHEPEADPPAGEPARSSTQKSRSTTAPMRRCLDEPDGSGCGRPPLHFLSTRYAKHIHHGRLVRRMRLIYGRSYTATVRRRFPTDAAAAEAGTLCPHAACTAAGQDETIEHVLLDCPYYAAARESLARALHASGIHELTLRTLLNPPNCTSKDRYLHVYDVTTAFLTAIARVRRSEQLPSLDGCPHYDYNPAPEPDRLPDGDNRLQAARQAAPLVALAAPLPLDTG